MKGRTGSLAFRTVVSIVCLLACLAATRNASAQTIQEVHVFQAAGPPGAETPLLVEIRGKDFPAEPRVLVDPLKGLTREPERLSATGSLVVLKLTTSAGYFPATVGLVGASGPIAMFDVVRDFNPNLPRIDDVEILKLDRQLGHGRIKIIGANFGTEKNNIVVSIVPRNPELNAFHPIDPKWSFDSHSYICRTGSPADQQTSPLVTELQDDMALVDFSFPCNLGYSVPFRIARVVLTLKASGDDPLPSASHEMMPARDPNLVYRYSILSKPQAKSRFGGGIAKNFYVVQLSIVNKGGKKLQVPLASIQAEVEWAAGQAPGKKFFIEGPATVSPVPLTGAISFFSAHRKSSGNRAIFFNSLQGLTTIGSAVQSFFAPGFTQGVAIAGGGFRQGAGQIFQDMSEEQLASLTAQSFETTETISGNGGSAEKVIFIQRGEEEIESFDKSSVKFSRLITNIHGFEITGYEVSETPGKGATPE